MSDPQPTSSDRGDMEQDEARGILDDLLSDLPGVVYRCRHDRDWTMIGLTETVEELTGYTVEELVGEHAIPFADIIHPDDVAQVREKVDEAVDRGEPFRAVYRIRTRGGEERLVLEQGRPIVDDDGDLLLTGYIQEVTGPVGRQLEQSMVELSSVREESETLELLQTVTAIANEESDLRGALERAIPEIGRSLGCALGHAFEPGDEDGSMRASGVWYRARSDDGLDDFRTATEGAHWSPTEGVPGRVQATGAAEWIEDVPGDEAFLRLGPSSPSPIRSGVAAPVVASQEVVAVIEFYWRERRATDPALARLLEQVGVHLGRVRERERARRIERRNETWLRLLATRLKVVLWISSPDGAVLYRSPGYREMLFGSRTVDDRADLLELVHPADRDRVEALLLDPDRAPYQLEFRLLDEDGSVRWMRQRAFPILEEGGQPARIGGLIEDVTARREERRRAAETSRLLEQTVSSIREAVLVVGGGDRPREIREANPAAERMFGYTREELVGQTTEPLHVDRASYERFGAVSRDVLEKGKSFRGTFRMKRRDGRVFDAEQTVTLLNPDEGLGGGVVSVVRDISERAAAEVKLRESETRFRQIAESIDDVFWITTPGKDVMEYVSPAYADVVGHPPEELYDDATRWLDRIHPDDRERVRAALPRQVDGTYEEEYRIVRSDGEIRWLWDRAFPVRDEDGNVVRIVGVAEDVTERRALEAQLQQSQKMEAVGRLAGGIAHDFNNLLTVIRSQSDLLLMDMVGSSPLRDEVEIVRDAADRATTLTRQFLALSEDQVLRPRLVDLNDVVTSMRELLRRVIGEDIRIETRTESDLPPVRVDPGQLEQVILNLAVNARDAMPRGGTLRISTRTEVVEAGDAEGSPELEPGRHVRLDVADTGIGMDAETRSRVFEPFFTTKRERGGTGLGLSTSYGIVQQSGGTIRVESTKGVGTTFVIRFPAAEGEVTPEGPVSQAPEPVDHATGTILLVEDDPSVRRVARKVLTRAGFEVEEAGDAEVGLAMLEAAAGRFDVVLTDLVLPGMGGRDLVDAIREHSSDQAVIVMSGYAAGSPGSRGELPPEIAFIRKPFTPEGLLGIVRENMPRTP